MDREGSGRRSRSGSQRGRGVAVQVAEPEGQRPSDSGRGRPGSGSGQRGRGRDTSLVLSATPVGDAMGPARTPPPDSDPVSEGPLRPADPDSWLDSLEAPSSASASAVTEPGAPPPAGNERRLGRYQILETVGKGGYGRVYKAWDPQLEREVAIKVLLRTDVNAYRRFAREIKVTARLRHPNIVAVYDSGAAHGLPYLVMDYVPGRSLWEMGKRLHELPPVEAARILCEVAQAIAHAHAQGILHRDIKPANVLVTPEGQAFVVDFGLARTEEMDRLTQTGAVLGTPLFMPLEQARARQQVDELCDVYALGATLYYALTGRPPHVAESLKELMAEMAGLPEAPSSLNPLVPAALDAVCLRALQPDRTRRTPSAAALADELLAIAGGAGSGSGRLPSALPGGRALDGVASAGRQLLGVAREGAGQGARALRRAIKGREKLVLTSGYAAVVTILCVSMLLRGREPAPAAASSPEAPGATAAALAEGPAGGPSAEPGPEGQDAQARAARALARARERGRDLERQARSIEREGEGVGEAVLEALKRSVSEAEPAPDAETLGLLGVLLARRGPDAAALARPHLDRAAATGRSERVELRFWRGVALASAGEPKLAEREWVLAREQDEPRLQDLRLAHQRRLQPAVRQLLLQVVGLPAEGLPTLELRAPAEALERARAVAEQLPSMAREDLISALTRAAEGRRWADVALGLKRLELWAKDSPLVALERARLLVGRGRIQEAQKALVRAGELGADAATLDRLGADLLWRQGRRADAAVAAAALARRERGPEGRAAGALHHLLGGRPEAALAEADLGLALDPAHVPCLLQRSLALAACGEPWSAMQAARRAWELDGLSDELLTAAWIGAQTGIVLASGEELTQGLVVNAWMSFQGLLSRCEGAFPRLVLARAAVAEPTLHEWADEWLSAAQQRAPRAAEVPLLRGAMALAAGEGQSAIDAAWSQARTLAPESRITPAWAASYREKTGAEPALPVE